MPDTLTTQDPITEATFIEKVQAKVAEILELTKTLQTDNPNHEVTRFAKLAKADFENGLHWVLEADKIK